MRKGIVIVGIAFFFFSCKNEEKIPSDIIKPEKMQNVFWDYLKADVYCAEIIKKDTSQNDTLVNLQLQKTIFSHYGITAEKFYKSYNFYITHPDLMTPILDSISSKQDRLNKSEKKPFFNRNYE